MTELKNYLVQCFNEPNLTGVCWGQVFDLIRYKNLWLNRVASLKYTRGVFGIRYGIESYRYNETRYVEYGVVKKVKDPE